MTSPFLSEIRAELSHDEFELLIECNINRADDLYSFAMTFGALDSEPGIDITKLSNLGARSASGSVLAVGHSIQSKGPPKFALGVSDAPSGAPSVGSTIPPRSSPGPLPQNIRKLDFRLPNWPVRDQGDRGTCVAHALAAAHEHGCGTHLLSPQFLFWATKKHGGDPFPASDGSRLEYAHKALEHHGVCEEGHWPYNGQHVPGNVTHEGGGHPSQPAVAGAASFRRQSKFRNAAPRGNAVHLFSELEAAGAPIAVSVPVFASLGTQDYTNWNSSTALVHGSVIDPPRGSVVVGAHAICVTGFAPDPTETIGGYFLFRNSWGTRWGSAASPGGQFHAPEPGYGQISATYVEKFVWEMCRLL